MVGGKNREPLSPQDMRNPRARSLTCKSCDEEKEVEWTESCTT